MELPKFRRNFLPPSSCLFNANNIDSSVILNIYTCLQNNIRKQCVVFIPTHCTYIYLLYLLISPT
jgi:hypothetical protein